MTTEEYKSRYKGLSQSEVRKLARTDADFRDTTERIYVNSFHAALNKSCGDCFCDAYALIMLTSNDKLMEHSTRHFELRAGVLLRDVRKDDNSKLCTHHNLTDELALYHLGTNPGNIKFFSKYPADWEEQSQAYIRNLLGIPTAQPKAEQKEPEKPDTKPAPKPAPKRKAVRAAK